MDLINCSPWYDQIIPIPKVDIAVHSGECTTAFMHKYHFISVCIFIKVSIHALLWCCQYNMQIAIYQDGFAAGQEIAFRLYFETFKAAVLQHVFFCYNGLHIYRRIRFNNLRGWVIVVQQRIIIAKAFGRKQLFCV